MLTREQLQRLIVKNQTSKINIYREYSQHLFLSFLYSLRDTDQVLFKGGTALRVAYQSPRYSEDLDFTLFNISNPELENKILAVSDGLEKTNLDNKITEAKQTTGGYLAKLVVRLYGAEVTISVQASRRKKNHRQPNVQLINNDFIPPYTALLLPESELIAEKIQAALTRAKPRDFFDIYFLLRHGKVPVSLRHQLQSLIKTVAENKVNFKQLSDYLPASMNLLVKDFENIFITEISKFI